MSKNLSLMSVRVFGMALGVALTPAAFAEEGAVKAAAQNLQTTHQEVVKERTELNAERAKFQELKKKRNEDAAALKSAVQTHGKDSPEAAQAREQLKTDRTAVQSQRAEVNPQHTQLQEKRKVQQQARTELKAARQERRAGRK